MEINKEKTENLLKLLVISFILIFAYLAGYLVATNNDEGYSCVKEPDNEKREKVRLSNRLIEKSAVNIKCDSGESGQKTYYNYNKDFHFKVEIMNNWKVDEYYNYNLYRIVFGPEYSRGGIWGISIYPASTNEESDIIAAIGDQFENRSETVTIIDENTKKVIVTTKEKLDWFAETYLIKKGNFIFVIGNGAVKNEDFNVFFDSFEFIN